MSHEYTICNQSDPFFVTVTGLHANAYASQLRQFVANPERFGATAPEALTLRLGTYTDLDGAAQPNVECVLNRKVIGHVNRDSCALLEPLLRSRPHVEARGRVLHGKRVWVHCQFVMYGEPTDSRAIDTCIELLGQLEPDSNTTQTKREAAAQDIGRKVARLNKAIAVKEEEL